MKIGVEKALAFWRFSTRSKLGQFGSLLNLTPKDLGGGLEIVSVNDRQSIVHVPVAKWCCERRSGRVMLSAVLAMLDEVSTYAGTVQWDKGMRPGVSIQLACRSLAPLDVGAGEMLEMETNLVKIGKTIGFVDITVRCAKTRKDLAQASHIKFMPMGFWFDVMLDPRVRSVTLPLWKWHLDREPMHSYQLPKSVDEILGLENVWRRENEAGGTLMLEPKHGNPIGSIHGGCGAMLGAHASRLCLEEEAKELVPRSIKTNLMASVRTKHGQTVEVKSAKDLQDGATHTQSLLSFNRSPCISTEIFWKKAPP